MAASIKDIAQKLNISPSTVSRALNNVGNISDDTVRRIQKVAKELNYVPNNIARSLQGARTKSVGIIIPDITETFFAKIVKGIERSMAENGYSILLCDSNENEDKERTYIRLLSENQVDGLIVATVQKSIVKNEFLSSSFPVIYVDNLPKSNERVNSITLDNVKASILAINHLVENGHTRIVGIMGLQDETTGYDRFAGFKEGLMQCGIVLDPTLVRFGDFKEQSGYDAIMDLYHSGEEFTAVYCSSSKMTYGVLQALRDLNLKMPDDISVVGFDVYDDYNMMCPGITTIAQPEEKIGTLAANTMLQMIKNNDEEVYQYLSLEPTLLVRDSVKNISIGKSK